MSPAVGRFERLVSAPELRARQTADRLGAGAVIEPALRDCDYGRWRGRSLGEIGAEDPAGAAAWIADPSPRRMAANRSQACSPGSAPGSVRRRRRGTPSA